MKKIKELLINFLRKFLIKKYVAFIKVLKWNAFIFIGILCEMFYENYIMYPSMDLIGDWIWYPHLFILFISFIIYGFFFFKFIKKVTVIPDFLKEQIVLQDNSDIRKETNG